MIGQWALLLGCGFVLAGCAPPPVPSGTRAAGGDIARQPPVLGSQAAAMRPQAETDGGVAARRAMDGGDNFDEADSQVQPVQLADPGSEAPGVAIPEGAGRIQDEARDELVRGMALANEVILGEVVARESSVDFNVVDGIRYMHSRGRATVDVHGVMKGRASVGERIEVEGIEYRISQVSSHPRSPLLTLSLSTTDE